jgi:hypothetical protein
MLPWELYMKRLRIRSYEIAAFAIIACSVIFRFILTVYTWPSLGSDDGTMGLEAMHIAFRGEHPIFFYGQNYMGVIEAYLGAVFFRLFGISVFSMRLGMILIFTLFLIAMYCLASLLYNKKLAIVTLFVLCFGWKLILHSELAPVGGVVETLLFGTLSFLLAFWLARTASHKQRQQQPWKRLAAYWSWGLVVGLGIWSHVLVIPFVLASGLILLIFCWREWRTLAIPCIIVGLVVGGFPLIVYNLMAPLSQNSLAVLLSIQGGNDPGAGVLVGPSGFAKHLVTTFLIVLPSATGFPVCNSNVMPIFGHFGPKTMSCSITQGAWSLGYMALLLISMTMALVPLRILLNEYRLNREAWSEEQRQLSVLHFTRLMLVFGGLLTITIYLHSTYAAAQPNTSRYLVGLLIVLPAVIWPFLNSFGHLSPTAGLNILWMTFRYSLLLFAIVFVQCGTIAIIPTLPGTQAKAAADQKLLHDLEQRDITRFYSDYWTCNRLTFLSKEQTICSDVNPDLTTAEVNRIPSYEVIIASDPKAAYVFPVGFFTESADHNPRIIKHYHRFMVDGYVVYEPSS